MTITRDAGSEKGVSWVADIESSVYNVLNMSSCLLHAPLQASLVLSRGTGVATFSRATKAWRFNELGYLQEVPSGCAIFQGARLVRNIAPRSETVSAGWTLNGVTAINDTSLLESSGGTVHQISTTTTTVGIFFMSVYLKRGVGSTRHIRLEMSDSSYAAAVNFDLDTGDASSTIQSGTFVLLNYGADSTLDSEGYRRFYIRARASVETSITFYLARMLSALNGDISYSGDGTSTILMRKAEIYNVTNYDTAYVPEYVSVSSSINKNFLLYTDDLSQGAWLKTNITVTTSSVANPINGVVNAQKVEATTTDPAVFQQSSSGSGSSSGNIFVIYAKKGSSATSANKFLLRNATTATNIAGISLNYDTGDIAYLVGSSGATVTNVGDAWYRVELSVSSGVSTGDQLLVYAGFTGNPETAGTFFYAYNPYLGHGVVAPASIPIVSNAWDPHGSKLDGAKYYETDWQGAPIPAANMLGFRKEPAATNNLLQCRDLSSASWSTKTNITASKTAIGLDGIANTSTTLTATATDAIILQPITLASAERCASAYVKRKTGTGTISFTQNGGSSWTDITSNINFNTYVRVQITSTLANPSVGFKISTNGDAIDVDVVQNEAGNVATSPIVTTTAVVTRNAEMLTYPTIGNIDFAVGTLYAEAQFSDAAVTRRIAVVGSDGYSYSPDNTAIWSIYDVPALVTKSGLSDMSTATRKRVVAWGSGTMKVTGDGLSPASGAFDGAFGGASTIDIGQSSIGYIRNIAIYNYAMTDAELRAVTA